MAALADFSRACISLEARTSIRFYASPTLLKEGIGTKIRRFDFRTGENSDVPGCDGATDLEAYIKLWKKLGRPALPKAQ